MVLLRVIVLITTSWISQSLTTSNERFQKLSSVDVDTELTEFLYSEYNRAKSVIERSIHESPGLSTTEFYRSINISETTIWEKKEDAIVNGSEIHNNGNSFVVVGSKIVRVKMVDNGDVLELPVLYEYDLDTSSIMFSKLFEWNGIVIHLFGMEDGYTVVYTSSANNNIIFNRQQIMKHPDFEDAYPVDGEFIVYNGNLYFFLIYTSVNHEKVTSILYRWQNTHFDAEIQDIFTKRATAVAALNYGSFVIIVVTQRSATGKDQVNSQVLLLSNKEGSCVVEQIQFLAANHPVSITTFRAFENDFILILQERYPSSIYWWEGGEFVEWHTLNQISGTKSIVPAYINGYTLLFSHTYTNQIQVFMVKWNNLQQIGTITTDGVIVALKSNSTRLIIALKKDNYFSLVIKEIKLHAELPDAITANNKTRDPLLNCFEDIEAKLSHIKDETNNLCSSMASITQAMNYEDKKSLCSVNNGELKSDRASSKSFGENNNQNIKVADSLFFDVEKLSNDASDIFANISERRLRKPPLIDFKQALLIDYLKINSVKARTVNGRDVVNSKFISLSREQFLRHVDVSAISVDWLVASQLNNKKTDDLVTNSGGNQIWQQNVSVENLTCCNILTNGSRSAFQINGLPLDKIVRGTSHIVEPKRIGNVVAKNITVINENVSMLLDNINASYLHLNSNVTVRNLRANTINGICVKDFLGNLFLRNNSTNSIHGDLRFTEPIKAKQIVTNKVNKEFLREVAVLLQHPRSSNSSEYLSKRSDDTSGNSETRRYIYEGKVIFEGSVHAQEVKLDFSDLIIGNTTVPIHSLDERFWTHGGNQTVSKDVVFTKDQFVDGDMSVKSINRIDIKNLLDVTSIRDIKNTVSLKNVSVEGNVTARYTGDYIDKIISPFDASTAILSTTESFDKPVNQLKENATEDEVDFNGRNIVNITIYGNVRVLGDVNIEDKNNSIYKALNKPIDYVMSNITASNITVKRINTIPFDKTSTINKIQSVIANNTIKTLIVNDDIVVKSIDVEVVNEVNIREVLPKVINGSKRSEIKGKKTFEIRLTVHDYLAVDTINRKSLDLLSKFLSKSKNQNISAEYTLRNVSVGSLETSVINNVDTSELVDVTADDKEIVIQQDVNFDKLIVNNLYVKNFSSCNLALSQNDTIVIRNSNWDSINVTGNVSWKYNQSGNSTLKKIFKDSVTKDTKQIIRGTVTFNNDVVAVNVTLKAPINKLDMNYIMSDTLTVNGKNQVINGEKIFVQKIYCSEAKVLNGDATISSINNRDILELNQTVIRKNNDQVIFGKKMFVNGFKTDYLYTEGTINGITTDNILTVNTRKKIPYVVFKDLEVIENLNFANYNLISMKDFFSNRISIANNGNDYQNISFKLTFTEDVLVLGDSSIDTLNGIQIDNVVVQNGSGSIQNIFGPKVFMNPVQINGDLDVKFINKLNVSDLHSLSVLSDRNSTIRGDVIFTGQVTANNVWTKDSFLSDQGQTIKIFDKTNNTITNFVSELSQKPHN